MDTSQLINIITIVLGALLGFLVRGLTKTIEKMDSRIELLFTLQTASQVADAKHDTRLTALESRVTNLEDCSPASRR